jgi:hypothetical protein
MYNVHHALSIELSDLHSGQYILVHARFDLHLIYRFICIQFIDLFLLAKVNKDISHWFDQ